MVVGNKIEDILLEVGAGAANGMDFVAADHFGQRDAHLGGAHGTGHGDQHASPGLEVAGIGGGGILERRRVEMPVVLVDELGNGTRCVAHGRILPPGGGI